MSDKKIVASIEARMTSSRLPGKVLMQAINGMSMLEFMVQRVKKAQLIDQIIVATTINDTDDPIFNICQKLSINCYRGSEDDVVERLYMAAKHYELDYFLAITADCPLVSYEFFDTVVEKYNQTNADLVRSFDLPHGMYLYGVKISAFRRILEIKGV